MASALDKGKGMASDASDKPLDTSGNPEWVTLESSDGYQFIVDYNCVTRIGSTIPNMLDMSSGFAEAQAGKAKFLDVRGVILEKVIEYLCWNMQNSNLGENERMSDFERRIPPEMVLELFMGADFFEV
ncbi:POZ domain-containing protein [Tilletiaria anomala UBC 951]|uniref:Elongin-C n=1 Tax=Tilletiaria anomala (strain ATCC 24038 / CBS 436.72 / UBC 951) TaxID=1037660 RepID=A0A066W0F3_TILAU|nr:POZ domain-containing protein [Tilletiaria anomala UBC 951]KDN44265.1 POZ domain-containing protein [Tilletiaria anomala UBC 951]